jgi:tripartite-type tricarboxylate transporter receptor subunit TctC
MFKKILVSLMLMVSSLAFAAQEVRVYMPFSVGGSTDAFGRWMTKKLSNSEYTFVMHNVPGALGMLAINAMRNYNGPALLTMSNGSLALENIDFDKEFEFVSFVGYEPTLFVTSKTNTINNIADLLNESKSRVINFGHAGVGSHAHLSHLVVANGNKNFQDIAYKTHTHAIPDLISNRIDTLSIDMFLADPLIKGGQLKPIATNYHRRLDTYPNVPTLREQKIQNYNYYRWMILLSSKTTDVKITELVRNLFKDPATVNELKQFGIYYEDVNEKTFLKEQREKLNFVEKTFRVQQ